MSAVARSDIATLELANQSVHTAAQVRRELTAAGAGTASVRVKLEAERRWMPAPTCDQRACTRSPAEKHAHVLRTARRAAADPARVGGMLPGGQRLKACWRGSGVPRWASEVLARSPELGEATESAS